MCPSPWLIAAYRALHRLRVPRHPPLAFCRLTTTCVMKQNTRGVERLGSAPFFVPRRDSAFDRAREVVSRRAPGHARESRCDSLPTSATSLVKQPSERQPLGLSVPRRAYLYRRGSRRFRERSRRIGAPAEASAPRIGIKEQLSEIDRCVEACDFRGFSSSRGRATRRSGKEVIQPQVPLRLPCYDFAPVMTLAFGRSPPCGLLHGLRALATSMA